MITVISRLYFIHIFAWLAVWLAMHYPGLDLILAAIYLIIISAEIQPLRKVSKWLGGAIFLAWQAPGIVLAAISVVSWSWWGFKEYVFFLLQFWYTPVLPLLSLLHGAVAGRPLYYYLLLGMPLLLAVLFMVMTGGTKKPAPAPVEFIANGE